MENEIKDRIGFLYGRDVAAAYDNLLWLEEFSEHSDGVYPYAGELLLMLDDKSYIVRVRGFRLLCKQAKWDRDNIINKNISRILSALNDEKPTAVRQKLQYLKHISRHKKELNAEIKKAVQALDLSSYKDSMIPLIEKDIINLLQSID